MEKQHETDPSLFSNCISFLLNTDARTASKNVKSIGVQFKTKMSQTQNNVTPSREGFAFEYLDAMNQQIDLGGKYKVEVLDTNHKNGPDIYIRDQKTDSVIQKQQQKINSRTADRVAKNGTYVDQEIRTPKGQTQTPKNQSVKEANVSKDQVSKAANNPGRAANQYKLKAAIAEIKSAAAVGAMSGAVAALLLSGLEHFLAVERGEIEIDEAITSVFMNALEGAWSGAIGGGTTAAVTAFVPALVPVLTIISSPLLVIGSYQLITQIGQIIDRHEFAKRNRLVQSIYTEESEFFDSFNIQVFEYLTA